MAILCNVKLFKALLIAKPHEIALRISIKRPQGHWKFEKRDEKVKRN